VCQADICRSGFCTLLWVMGDAQPAVYLQQWVLKSVVDPPAPTRVAPVTLSSVPSRLPTCSSGSTFVFVTASSVSWKALGWAGSTSTRQRPTNCQNEQAAASKEQCQLCWGNQDGGGEGRG
jgi:hypothetical protein